ncbi:hypothetical protein BHM03_00051510 [Ensete ventricosum]|nr:hypothetical protein BHM03_00051510 [Ensete ventricosum]
MRLQSIVPYPSGASKNSGEGPTHQRVKHVVQCYLHSKGGDMLNRIRTPVIGFWRGKSEAGGDGLIDRTPQDSIIGTISKGDQPPWNSKGFLPP